MTQSRTDTLLLMLMGVVVLLMIANIGLFLRMNQLQQEVLAALQPLQAMSSRPEGLEIGTKAPQFTLPDTEGRMVSLEDFAGREVLLLFSSIQCSACAEMYPYLGVFSQRHPDVAVLMLSRGSAEENQSLVEAQGYAFPILAWDNAVARDYQIPGVPFCYVIDGEGMIANAGFANTLEQLEALAVGGKE